MGTRKPHGALQIIRDEHFTRHRLALAAANAAAMLFYIEEFPEKRHHPKESWRWST